jgi:hypothetical protein
MSFADHERAARWRAVTRGTGAENIQRVGAASRRYSRPQNKEAGCESRLRYPGQSMRPAYAWSRANTRRMQVFDVFDGYRPRVRSYENGLNATQVMLVMKTLVQFTEQIYQHPFAPLHALPPQHFVFETMPQRPTWKPYGLRSMRAPGRRWAQKDTSGAEGFPTVRRAIS